MEDNHQDIVRLEEVSLIYQKDVVALQDVNLSIKEGEFVSIVGRSGAGKSSLIRLLIGEDKPTDGMVYVNGWYVGEMRNKEMPDFRRHLGVVFQNFRLLTKKTVYENVAFALMVSGKKASEIAKMVPQVLNLVGLAGKEERFPDELSGGEQQRVGIARAFVHRPKLMIADELTGDLDALYAWEIMEILLKINKMGTTVLMATHDRDIVNRIHKRVLTLEDGRIIRDQVHGEYVI